MTSRRILLVTALVLLSAPAAGAAPEAAAADTTCTYEHDVSASPGLSTSPSSGSVTSRGETETITCDGPVNGKQQTGPGTVGFEGRYGTNDPDTCQSGGEGDGIHPQHVDDPMKYTCGAFKAGAPFAGKWQGDRTTGTFDVQPIDGECASNPVSANGSRHRFSGTSENPCPECGRTRCISS